MNNAPNRKDCSKCVHCCADLVKMELMCQKSDPPKSVTDYDCNNCPDYKSRYIEYPITVSNIEVKEDDWDSYAKHRGCRCRVRLADDSTHTIYDGILLGELPLYPTAKYSKETQKLTISLIRNPAIWVPDLKRVVYGNESWWSRVDADKSDA